VDASTVLRREGTEFCRERLVLDHEARVRPGVLAGVRVVDSVLVLGARPGEHPQGGTGTSAAPTTDRSSLSATSDLMTYELLEPGSTLTRYLGTSLADSPLTDPDLVTGLAPPPRP
jgi:hypothetical protein